MAFAVQGRPKKAKQVNSKAESMLIIFFNIKGIVHKGIVLAGQTVSSAYYCDVSWRLHEMCKHFAANFGDKGTGCCFTTTDPHTSFFTRESFTKINMTVVLHPPYFPPFPRLKIKLKGHHFDTIQ
jgi:hypothetical protein